MPSNSTERGFSLSKYIEAIRHYPSLSLEQERAAVDGVKNRGDASCRDALVKSHLKFVVTIARQYQGLGLPFEDLIAEGNLGLILAVDHFDPERGAKFISCAVWWIRKTILAALAKRAFLVHVPGHQLKRLRVVQETARRLSHELGRMADCKEISIEAGVPMAEVQGLAGVRKRTLSLHEAGGREGERSLSEVLADGMAVDPERGLIRSETHVGSPGSRAA